MQRFYKTVHHELKDNLYCFYLDNKPIKTPMGTLLSTQSQAKADAVVAEWDMQTDTILLNTMPITRYLNSVHDKIIPNYAFIIRQLLDYADNDCLFYFTQKTESDLYHQQITYWLPIIRFFQSDYAVTLHYGSDLILNKQCDDFKNHLQDFFQTLSFENLAGLYTIITILGSVLLGLYAYQNHIPYDIALKYARLEEDYNIQHWGLDPEITKKRNFIDKDYQETIIFLGL